MNTVIKIQDINSSYLEELEDEISILSIFGGEITTETSLPYDVGYGIGWGADKVRDGVNWVKSKF